MKPVKNVNIILIFFILISCSQDEVVDIDTLARAYVDILVVKDYYAGTDSVSIKKDEIFKKYSISEQEYNSSFERLGSDREQWDNFFDLANNYLDSLKKEVKNEKLLTRP